jgi:propanol-preferring alcohol dehydrogenase
MRAWVMTAPNEPLRQLEIPDPLPGEAEVLIRVRAAGLCHSDIGFLDGTLQVARSCLPLVLGHEIAGDVIAAGTGVSDSILGTRVVVQPGMRGPGTGRDGGFAPYVAVPVESLAPIPDGLDYPAAAVATDAGATSYRAVVRTGAVTATSKVGIIGAGGLGNLGIQHALAVGAHVHVADIDTAALALADQLPVTATAPSLGDFGNEHFDVIIDFAGVASTTNEAVQAIRPGGTVVVVGLGATIASISTWSLVTKFVTLRGSLGGDADDLAAVLALMADGRVIAATENIGFNDLGDGIERLRRHDLHGSRLVAVFA